MPYTPRLACLRAENAHDSRAPAVSPPSEIPVRPVRTGEGVLDLPLSRFATEGQPLEARVPWWDETIWFVPGVGEAEELLRKGVSRGRIWTAAELRQIADLDAMTDDDLRSIGRIKAQFGASAIQAQHSDPTHSPSGSPFRIGPAAPPLTRRNRS